jgi:protein TonB
MTHQYAARCRDDRYDRDLRLAAIAALLLVIVGFLVVRPAAVRPYRPHSSPVLFIDQPPALDGSVPEPPRPRVRPKLPVAAPDGGDLDPGVTTGDSIFDVPRGEPDYPEIPFGRVVQFPPKAVILPRPGYPELCRSAGIEGKVVLRLLVEPDSSVSRAELLSSSGSSLLDEAALDAARRARFVPGRQGIQVVRVWVAVPYDFRLN